MNEEQMMPSGVYYTLHNNQQGRTSEHDLVTLELFRHAFVYIQK